ncbi:MAG: quinone oxidoreductase [Polyangia bacterium]|jgi:NADPH2:quinone reductase
MTKAIRIHDTGGPQVMAWEEVMLAAPGPGEALVRHHYVGVNFVDVYHRRGVYKLPLPSGLGSEAAGVVEAVGAGVADFRPGDRVACGTGPVGAYAEARVVPADRLVHLPDDIDHRTAACIMLKGLTAQYLLLQTTHFEPGDTILVHAAAGGVGQIACQWAKHLGATVIGTVGSDEKAALARAHGCDHAIVYTRENFVERVREITGRRGVRVVYDGVGKDTFAGSLDCLQPRGLLVMFGQSSGVVPPFDLGVLSAKGSLYLTRPTLGTYAATPEALRRMAGDLFQVVRTGAVRIQPPRQFPLREAASAHAALEARATTGSIVLVA